MPIENMSNTLIANGDGLSWVTGHGTHERSDRWYRTGRETLREGYSQSQTTGPTQ